MLLATQLLEARPMSSIGNYLLTNNRQSESASCTKRPALQLLDTLDAGVVVESSRLGYKGIGSSQLSFLSSLSIFKMSVP